MREYAKVAPQFWTDHMGRQWPVIRSARRLKFKYPAHAALRAFVFHRDGYRCLRCSAVAIDVPDEYTGRSTLWTDRFFKDGGRVLMVVDHVLTLKAGGRNAVENFQSLCELCNRKKISEDNAAVAAYRGSC